MAAAFAVVLFALGAITALPSAADEYPWRGGARGGDSIEERIASGRIRADCEVTP